MSSATPSALYIESMGSLTAHIAVMGTMESGDYWLSSITNIVAIFANMRGAPVNATFCGSSASFTASNGTIWLNTGTKAAGMTLLVLSGAGY